MTRKKQPPKNPRLSVQDLDGSLRHQFIEIATLANYNEHSVAQGVRHSAGFTLAELRRVTAPLDYTTCTPEELITLCAHGNDWRTRESAARELVRRSEVTR